MKMITCHHAGRIRLALLYGEQVYPIEELAKETQQTVPCTMLEFLDAGEWVMEWAMKQYDMIKSGRCNLVPLPLTSVELKAPLPQPRSLRDGYAFRQHVEAARKNRGVEMIPEFDEFPVFYFSNHLTVQGPGDVWCMPDHFHQLDFELEWAVIIGKKGMNIRARDADKYIAGYTIMNDMSARTLQMEEMKLNLGPAKGKDFSTVIGPWLVTPDELSEFLIACKPGHTGNNYHLKMTCKINGELVSEGNTADMDWTFAEIIERCAYGVPIMPGDVIGSGTVGTGCFLELNGTGKRLNPDYQPRWLQENDIVEMEVTALGKLTNTIRRIPDDFSLLALKKKAGKTVSSL